MRSLRCLLGKHTGQAQGGLAFFHCPRCQRTLLQTNPRYISAMERVRFLEKIGDQEGAIRVFEETTGQKLKRENFEEVGSV